jgi:5-(aminomethyl)-3-furanmethanol phosphate kinase
VTCVPPAVVKLGGSYAHAGELTDWLAALRASAGRIVLVPGGGPFADAVRAAQAVMRFDDHAAHRMALHAMAQYGCAIAGLDPAFVLAPSLEEIAAEVRRGRVPVWSPVPMAVTATDLPASWDVSSDSLAVWLANAIGARCIVFVKRIARCADHVGLQDLVGAGILDRFVPRLLGPTAEAYLLGSHDRRMLLATGVPAGARIVCQ